MTSEYPKQFEAAGQVPSHGSAGDQVLRRVRLGDKELPRRWMVYAKLFINQPPPPSTTVPLHFACVQISQPNTRNIDLC
jgi:hypothetical protein